MEEQGLFLAAQLGASTILYRWLPAAMWPRSHTTVPTVVNLPAERAIHASQTETGGIALVVREA